MIPKIIPFCWFGRKSLPKLALKCIRSWEKFLPDYKIREWNEDNFDVNIIPYTKISYQIGKYAFVSDYARYWILYHNGDLYFDTDVELIRPINDIIDRGAFLGIEKDRGLISVAPGLGMDAFPGMSFYRQMLQVFESWTFCNEHHTPDALLVAETTKKLESLGFKGKDSLHLMADIYIYPNEYFNPMDDYTGRISIIPNTRSVYYYSKSWIENYGLLREKNN